MIGSEALVSETRICRRCLIEKPLSKFARTKAGDDSRRRNQCMRCGWESRRSTPEQLQRMRNREAAYARKYVTSLWGWAKRKEAYLRHSAKQINVPFNLDADDILSALPSDGCCPALGIQLEFFSSIPKPSSPSVDRVIPSLGYVPGNIAIISKRANQIKQDATPDEIARVASWAKSVTSESMATGDTAIQVGNQQ